MRATRRLTTAGMVLLAAVSFDALAQAQSLRPSPDWALAMPPGPDAGAKITEAYARLVARDAYFWAWPMVNVYNRRLSFSKAPEAGLLGGVLPVAPLNRLSMLHDYIKPDQRFVACPNQDVVYGAAFLALDVSPVVVQVPDFGDRFWVYQVSDSRTDSFAQLGQMYATAPGFYLLVGPNWHGEVPKGITKVFRATSQTGAVFPRVFQDNTPQDKQAVQTVIDAIDIYPLAEYDGTMKRHDWSKLPSLPAAQEGSGGETRWVSPEAIFDQLPAVLADAPAATRDAVAVSRQRNAGFIPIGRTNMAEFAYSAIGLNTRHGTPASRARRPAAAAAFGQADHAAAAKVGRRSRKLYGPDVADREGQENHSPGRAHSHRVRRTLRLTPRTRRPSCRLPIAKRTKAGVVSSRAGPRNAWHIVTSRCR